MRILYTLGIHLYHLGIIIVGLTGNNKAIKWLEGRHRWRKKLQRKKWNSPIWIHTASLGEFEQAKPLIELIRKDEQLKDKQILVTFFSPSGYLVSKNYDLVTGLYYLPLDTIYNAKSFINIVQPSIAVFVKYDFWFNYLLELQRKKIPTLFFSCNFRKNQPYFKRASQWQKNIMRKIDYIYSLNEDSQLILEKHAFQNAGVCGDTRYDKVAQNAERKSPNALIEQYKNGEFILIGGSTWPAEEALLWQFHQKHPEIKIIIAPHDVSASRIDEIQNLFQQQCTLYSNYLQNETVKNNLLLIDNIGMLSNIYQYSDVALVGGGFTNDLHNILEPAAMSNVILFGNKTDKYPEASALVKYGGSFSIDNYNDFEKRIEFLINDSNSCEQMKILCKQFVHSHVGATQLVFEKMHELMTKS
jgi:3-deoxy-D-manno-octulosonic-acid transferase